MSLAAVTKKMTLHHLLYHISINVLFKASVYLKIIHYNSK